MKRIAILFLVFALAGTTVMAQDGMKVGVDFGIMDLDYASDSGVIRPVFIYETSFDDFELYVEAGLPFWMSPEVWLGLDAQVKFTYNMDLSGSKLALFVDSHTLIPFMNNWTMSTNFFNENFGYSTALTLWLIPGAKFTMDMDFGDLYFEATLPSLLVTPGTTRILLFLTAGLDMDSFGFGVTVNNAISPNADFFRWLDIFGHLELDPVYIGLNVSIPLVDGGMEWIGMEITPEVRFGLDSGLSFFGKLPISGIGTNDYIGTSIGLILGVRFEL
ncbi:MAG: hypothetical protein FWD28_01365 [Treponema sp.]|nr:hypothetical protein [Treponema sp.]